MRAGLRHVGAIDVEGRFDAVAVCGQRATGLKPVCIAGEIGAQANIGKLQPLDLQRDRQATARIVRGSGRRNFGDDRRTFDADKPCRNLIGAERAPQQRQGRPIDGDIAQLGIGALGVGNDNRIETQAPAQQAGRLAERNLPVRRRGKPCDLIGSKPCADRRQTDEQQAKQRDADERQHGVTEKPCDDPDNGKGGRHGRLHVLVCLGALRRLCRLALDVNWFMANQLTSRSFVLLAFPESCLPGKC